MERLTSGRGISRAQLPHCRSNSGPRYPGSSVWGQAAYRDTRNCLVDNTLLSLRPDADLSVRIKERKETEELCLSLKGQALVPDLGFLWPHWFFPRQLWPPAVRLGFLMLLSHRSLGEARKLEWAFLMKPGSSLHRPLNPGREHNTLDTCGDLIST